MKGMNEWSAKKGSNTAAPAASRNSKKIASGVTRKWVPRCFFGNPALGASQKNMASSKLESPKVKHQVEYVKKIQTSKVPKL